MNPAEERTDDDTTEWRKYPKKSADMQAEERKDEDTRMGRNFY